MESRGHGAPNYCADCGARLPEGASFCSQCGTSVSGSEDPPSSDFRERVREYTVHGWEVEQEYGDRVVVRKRGFGSLPVHIALFLFTGGVGNVLYAWYRYSPGASRAELRADGTERWVDGRSRWGFDVAAAVGVLVGVSLLSMAATVVAGISPFVTIVLALALVLGGLLLFVPVQRRLGARESATTFGRHRTLVTEPADGTASCIACGNSAGGGLERTYAERFYLAGVPLRTFEEGSNSYCHRCAVEEDIGESPASKEPMREFA